MFVITCEVHKTLKYLSNDRRGWGGYYWSEGWNDVVVFGSELAAESALLGLLDDSYKDKLKTSSSIRTGLELFNEKKSEVGTFSVKEINLGDRASYQVKVNSLYCTEIVKL